MQAAEASQLRQRAQFVLRGSIPPSVERGGVSAVHQFKDDMAVVARFVRLGTGADKAKLAVLRVEGTRAAEGASSRRTEGGAARSATPPSNTGVNEGRQWLLGSGL